MFKEFFAVLQYLPIFLQHCSVQSPPLSPSYMFVYIPYTLFQNGGCLRRSGSSSTRARHRGPRFNVYMFTCGSIVQNMPQNCCVPGCKKKVYEEDGVKISFHKFHEDRELFRKWIVAIRRDVGKESDRTYEGLNRMIVSHHLQAVKKA